MSHMLLLSFVLIKYFCKIICNVTLTMSRNFKNLVKNTGLNLLSKKVVKTIIDIYWIKLLFKITKSLTLNSA